MLILASWSQEGKQSVSAFKLRRREKAVAEV